MLRMPPLQPVHQMFTSEGLAHLRELKALHKIPKHLLDAEAERRWREVAKFLAPEWSEHKLRQAWWAFCSVGQKVEH